MEGNVCGHYVAIAPDEVEKVSEGGIVLAAQYNDDHASRELAATTTGTVISIGPDAWVAFKSNKPWAKVGDRVSYMRHTGKVILDEGDLDVDGQPKKVFVFVDENVIWNYGGAKDE